MKITVARGEFQNRNNCSYPKRTFFQRLLKKRESLLLLSKETTWLSNLGFSILTLIYGKHYKTTFTNLQIRNAVPLTAMRDFT